MNPIKGRGATGNRTSERFALPERIADGDWLDEATAIDGAPLPSRTQVTHLHPRTILSFNRSPDIPFDRSINSYNGCEHGCIYCFARPSHAYHDLSPGLDFETKLFAKPQAAQLLRETLAKRGYRPAPIAMGTNTDPYQPIEGRYRITRQILELCLETRHPVTITTKSDRVLRDVDLLAEMARHNLVSVGISVTSLDAALSRLLEPRAAAPAKRVAALGRLIDAGVPAHVSIAPVIPWITDHFIEAILEESAKVGVRSAMWIIIRLPYEVAPLFRDWLAAHFPDRAGKVTATIRDMRGGRDNDPRFFNRMRPGGVWADLFRKRFRIAARKHGIGSPRHALDCSAFRPPGANGQLSLF
jgi:DNA repair photolyase